MENVTVKSEILKDLKELKSKGVNVVIHDLFLERALPGTFTINSGGFTVGSSIISSHNIETKVNVLKKPSELTVSIYLNSTEDEIKNQISAIKNHIKTIEKESKSTAIVDFLKESEI